MKKTVGIAVIAIHLAATSAVIAAQQDAVHPRQVAEQHCLSDWRKITEISPNLWKDVKPFKVDQSLDRATTVAFNKYSAAVLLLADYVGSFLMLSEEAGQNPDFFALTHAKFDLLTCLSPTNEERQVITSLMQTRANVSEAEARAALFEGFDQFRCMGVDQASELVFRLDPSDASFAADYSSIVSDTMRVCQQ